MRNLLLLAVLFYVGCSTANNTAKIPIDKFLHIDSTILENEISKYRFADGDTLMDVGSGYGYNDEIIFKFYPNMFFIMEDISNKYLKESRYFIVENGIKKYFKHHYKKITGTSDTIPVPSGKYKNVLCRTTLHEFTNKQKMISELKRILDPHGQLIIFERIPKFEGEKDNGCKKTLLNKSEILALFTSSGFNLISLDSTNYQHLNFGGNAYIFRFSL